MHGTPVLDSPAHGIHVQDVEPAFLNVEDAGRYIGKTSKREVYRLIERKEIKAVLQGRKRLVVFASLKAYAVRLIEAADNEVKREAKAATP